jgi:hypothetical protein
VYCFFKSVATGWAHDALCARGAADKFRVALSAKVVEFEGEKPDGRNSRRTTLMAVPGTWVTQILTT